MTSSWALQVCYYRYLRFYSSGKFLYKVSFVEAVGEIRLSCFLVENNSHVSVFLLLWKNQISSQRVKEVVKCMNFRASKADCVFKGDSILSGDQVIYDLWSPFFIKSKWHQVLCGDLNSHSLVVLCIFRLLVFVRSKLLFCTQACDSLSLGCALGTWFLFFFLW